MYDTYPVPSAGSIKFWTFPKIQINAGSMENCISDRNEKVSNPDSWIRRMQKDLLRLPSDFFGNQRGCDVGGWCNLGCNFMPSGDIVFKLLLLLRSPFKTTNRL